MADYTHVVKKGDRIVAINSKTYCRQFARNKNKEEQTNEYRVEPYNPAS